MEKDPNVDKATQERFQAEQLLKEAGSKEEYAAEIAPSLRRPATSIRSKKPPTLNQTEAIEALTEPISTVSVDEDIVVASSRTIGYIAIIIAVASLFMWPAILGSTAVVLGIIAWFKGNRALGAWSMILGFIAVTTFFVLIPLYA
ncbi:hypothetical protein D3C73_555110 [compost metagenome]